MRGIYNENFIIPGQAKRTALVIHQNINRSQSYEFIYEVGASQNGFEYF